MKRHILTAVAAVLLVSAVVYADTKISEMTAAGSLDGTEVVGGVQSGASVKITTQSIADLGAAGSGDDVSIDGAGVSDPDFVSTGDIDFVDTSNTVTANINADAVGTDEMADADHGDVAWSGGAATVQASTALSSEIDSDISTHAGVTATHGATGAVVGTTNVQTLTNKTLNDTTNSIHADVTHKYVRNESGGILTAGTPVYISGWNVGLAIIEVSSADSDDPTKMPALGIVEADIANNASGMVVLSGIVDTLDTSSWSTGDGLYVSTTAGVLTNTRPTGTTAAIQKVGTVLRDNNGAGSIMVTGANRSNDVPNLQSAYLWVGNATNVATAVQLSSDVTMDNAGAVTIGADTVALTTDTTGNYTASIADAGNTTITVVNGATEGGAVTLDAVDLNCTNCIGDTEITTHAGTSLAADLEEEVTEGSLADSVIVSADIKDDTIDSADYAAASIDNEHLADDAVGVAEIATDAVTMDAVDADGVFTSLTGAWATTGLLSGGVVTKAAAAAYTIGTTNAAESYGGVIYTTAAAVITIPSVAAGMNFSVISVGTHETSLSPAAADKIVLDGTAMADNEDAVSTSTTGDTIVCTYYSADGWYCTSNSWTEETP